MLKRPALQTLAMASACLALCGCANGRGIFLAGPGVAAASAASEDEEDAKTRAQARRSEAVVAASGTAWLAWSVDPARDVLLEGASPSPTTAPTSGLVSLATGALSAGRGGPAALGGPSFPARTAPALGAAPPAAPAPVAPPLNAAGASMQLLTTLGGAATRVATQLPPTPPLLAPRPAVPGAQPLGQLLDRVTAPVGGRPGGGLTCGLLPCRGGG